MTAIDVCDRLAILGRSGYTVRGALIELPARLDDPDAPIRSASRRARLGLPIADCAAAMEPLFGPSLPQLVGTLVTSKDSGSDWADGLDDLGTTLRERDRLTAAAETAGAGATLSARTIAVLPLLMIPAVVRELGESFVAISVGTGIVLGYLGYRWLIRLVPAAPPDPPASVVARSLAASLAAGTSLDQAIRDVTRGDPQLGRAARLVELGAPCTEALTRVVPELGAALGDARKTGLPVRTALDRAADAASDASTREFDRRVARTPVRMVVPLVCCILPSFVLIAIVPLLRGFAQGS